MHVKKTKKIVVLATGGTIAGWANDPKQPLNYLAGQVDAADLLTGFGLEGHDLVTEQVAQVDSKDMSFAIWQSLLRRLSHWLAVDDVQGVVITHGTDTVEETAYFLSSVLPKSKPIALTCAMLPANAPDADGPANLREALAWVASHEASGVSLVCAGQVHQAHAVQKTHSQWRNPFTSQEVPAFGTTLRTPSLTQLLGATAWPMVALIFNHSGADGREVRAMMAQDPPDGFVVAGTGNGTVHQDLEAALVDAQAQGAQVLRASRCAWGGVQTREGDVFPHAGHLTAVQARIALILHLLSLKQT
jgi:L-asparaginase